MNFLKVSWSSFASTVKGFDTPRQLAGGVMFGLMVGLIPKDSLMPYFILLIALLSNANLLTTGLTAAVFSWLSPLLDPLSHQIGSWALTFDPIEPMWIWIAELPIVPWTRFSNTVVMGTLVLGLALALPTYGISVQFFRRFRDPLLAYISNNRFVRWIVGNPASPGNPSPNLQKS